MTPRGNAAIRGAGNLLPQVARGAEALGPAWRARLGDAAYGLYSGSDSDNPLVSAATNMAGGMFGRGASRVAGRAVRGVTDPAVNYLADRGFPLTLGQIVGNSGRAGQIIRGIEDRIAGIPVVGSFIGHQQRRGLEHFNRAAFEDAVAPIPGAGRYNGAVGEPGLENVRQLRSRAYSDALDPVTLQIDPQLTSDLSAARIAGRNVPMSNPSQFDFTMSTNVDPFISSSAGISGRDLQTAIRGIRRARSGAIRAGELNAHEYGNALGQVEDALTGAVNRQSPGTMPALNAANAANARVSTIRDAMRTGAGQVGEVIDPAMDQRTAALFTPAQLNRASIGNVTKYGGPDAAMSTTRPFYDLTQNALSVLPNRVPDSGTAGRLLVPLALGGVLGGGGEASDRLGLTDSASSKGLLAAAALSLPYTRVGRRAIQAALLGGRGARAQRVGSVLADGLGPRIGGMFGAPLTSYGYEQYDY